LSPSPAADPDAGRPAAAPIAPPSTRSVAETGIATIVLAGCAGLQGLLFLHAFGINARTDGFFAAYALYVFVSLFGQTLRTSAVPLLTGTAARMTVGQFAWAVAGMCAIAAVVAGAGAPVLARVLAPGLDAGGRAVTESALRILAAGTALQIAAAGGATVLGMRGHLAWAARAYGAGALAGLVAFVALIGPAGEQALAWATVVSGAAVLVLMLPAFTLRPGERPAITRIPRHIGWLLVSSLLGLALSGLYVPTLAIATGTGEGVATLLAYAYLLVGYLNGVTAGPVSMGTMIAIAPSRGEARALVDRSLLPGFRFSFLLAAPGLALAAVIAPPLLHALLPGQVGAHDTSTLQAFILLLGVWLVAALLAALTFPALFSAGLMMRINALLIPMLVIHIAAGLAGRALFGSDGVVAAMGLAPGLLVVAMLAMSHGRRAPVVFAAIARDGLRIAAVVIATIGLLALLGGALDGAAARIAGALLGALAYAAIIRRLFPAEWGAFEALVRRRSHPARAGAA
jgi:hypothetical protein